MCMVHALLLFVVKQQMIFTVSLKITSLTLEYSYDCPQTSAVTLKNVGKYSSSEPTRNYSETNKNETKHNNIICIFGGI